ncbi:dTDP-4-dehydrorhamnose 3,5-epimerase family protein [Azotobacter chroococcum]|jgi:dTDP-4-dehydrorhamnose 3,5-epimerase|uniref:dTDP-4-dehydrorhamnose 3,5-epimerase n=1 Tax=Azotobacter chroococcum TaxID=353 RepID=A0A4R1P5Z4_9GAMM|nr:dTDP-4-dehydrorhamnose 3,5-epimerase [Azotobacter chroococcum]TBV94869.1 dTDP-4-keto-6-deoxy-D-glucose epimerase [Azotobacter chroococcum]TCL21659.1 dTDP-4-dehydrorhamnose 3,5-epimerase [Azotobacter chroococcum]
MSRFSLSVLPLAGLVAVERHPLGDSRGFLARLFCAEALASAGWKRPIAQINHTYTAKRGTVRGLHFQRPPNAEMKLVSCLRGEVWDVAVDLRADSLTFLQWHAERLSAANSRALLIPEGFAHGFQALSDDVELLYCHSAAYAAESEAGLHPQDPRLDIRWPLDVAQMSPRDVGHPLIESGFEGVCQ